jgi:crotonobetainyl-CoA:carnitine CoA-transferase CaiB-like acyl-CoA transferase
MPGPLDGIRVVDLTTIVSGPVATMMLADQGADVVKIEPPRGEQLRRMGIEHRGLTTSFVCCNRNKRSLCLDLKSEAGLQALRRLIATADVFVQNFRPGTAERMGLGEDAVRAVRPDIVYVSISGFGEKGPYSHQRVYDPVIQALCGLADIQADRDSGRPRMVRTIVPDKTTSVTAAQAITAALFARERQGIAQHVRLAMLDTMVAYLWPEGMSALSFVGHESDPARGQMGLDLVYETQDRYITAGAVSDAEWRAMCRVLGREDLIDDERFATSEARARNVAARREITSAEIRKWSSADLLERFDAEGVPCAPILNRWELLDDPQVRENAMLEIHDDPNLGPVRQPRPAARFEGTPATIRSMAPYLGQHNEDILTDIGYSGEEISALEQAGVLHRQAPPDTAP